MSVKEHANYVSEITPYTLKRALFEGTSICNRNHSGQNQVHSFCPTMHSNNECTWWNMPLMSPLTAWLVE